MSVYALRDPRDGRTRYVGMSYRPSVRLRRHVRHPHSARLAEWIAELRAAGLEPELRLLDGGTEREWILRLSPDLNHSFGSDLPSRPGKEIHFTVWVTASQKVLIDRAATTDGDSPGPWIRKVVLRAARRVLGVDESAAPPLAGSERVDTEEGQKGR